MNGRIAQPKRGVATLEFVLCLPIILALTVAIIWLGFSVVGQSQVAVEARHEAWKQRFDGEAGKALDFLSDDFATEDATTNVKITPIFDDISPPESSHDIAVGLWDHKKLELNKAPNWEHYLTAAVNAKTGGLQVAYMDARNELSQLQSLAANAIVEEIQNTIREFLENPLAELTNLGGDLKDEAKNKADQEKHRIDRHIQAKRAEIKRVEARIGKLENDKQKADDAKSIESRIKIQRNKLKRLEAELELLRQDRKSLD